ncbi:sulfotransferase 2A8-like [Glandiceps talaboti]
MALHQQGEQQNMADSLTNFQYRGVTFPFYIDESKLKSDIRATFPWRESDVIVAGCPKSGTTWLLNALQNMQEFSLMSYGDSTEALYFEWFIANPETLPGITGKLVKQIQAGQLHLKSPRLIRSHLPLHLFPWKQARKENVKIIYVTRNPKDVCVSVYHHLHKMFQGKRSNDWNGTVDKFIKGRTFYGPWLQHVIDWKKVGIEDNVLHISYEDMQESFRDEIRKVGKFLQVSLSSEDVDRVERACSVDQMRKYIDKYFILDRAIFKGDSGDFVRKGIVGDWKNNFLVAQNEIFDKEIVGKLEEKGIFLKYQIL